MVVRKASRKIHATTDLSSVTSFDGSDWRDSLYQFTRSLGFEPPGLFRCEHPPIRKEGEVPRVDRALGVVV